MADINLNKLSEIRRPDLFIDHSGAQTFIWMLRWVIFSNNLSLFLSRILVPTSERSMPYISPLSLSSPALSSCMLELSVLLFNISFSILRSTKDQFGPARFRSVATSLSGCTIAGITSGPRFSICMSLKRFWSNS